MTRRRLRILCLLPFSPDAGAHDGGGQVSAQTIIHLARRHDVGVLHLRRPGERAVAREVAGPVFVEGVEARPTPAGRGGRGRRAVRARTDLLRGRPRWAGDLASAAFAHRVRLVVDAWQPDVVQADYAVMAQFLPSSPTDGRARVMVDYDPAPEAFAEHARRPGAGWLDRADARAWARFQTVAMRRADAVVVFTERDRAAALARAPGAGVHVIPPGTEPPPPAPPGDPAVAGRIVFVGNFAHPPNTEAAQRLLVGILPRVRREVPEAELWIVGPGAPDELVRLGGEGVHFTGRVEEVLPFVRGAAVVALPISSGGGIRIKTLEALSAGAAVVASARALEGIPVTDGVHVLVAETDEQFADAIGALLTDDGRRRAMGGRAAACADENLGWDAAMSRWDGLYAALLSGTA